MVVGVVFGIFVGWVGNVAAAGCALPLERIRAADLLVLFFSTVVDFF